MEENEEQEQFSMEVDWVDLVENEPTTVVDLTGQKLGSYKVALPLKCGVFKAIHGELYFAALEQFPGIDGNGSSVSDAVNDLKQVLEWTRHVYGDMPDDEGDEQSLKLKEKINKYLKGK